MRKMKFKLNNIEELNFNAWKVSHGKNCPPNKESSISVTFTPTSIGTVVTCKCSKCSLEKDITDYDTW